MDPDTDTNPQKKKSKLNNTSDSESDPDPKSDPDMSKIFGTLASMMNKIQPDTKNCSNTNIK